MEQVADTVRRSSRLRARHWWNLKPAVSDASAAITIRVRIERGPIAWMEALLSFRAPRGMTFTRKEAIVATRPGLAITFALSVASAAPLRAQASTAGVDSIFATFDRRDAPGCAVSVVDDGRTVVAKGYGLASLEHDLPITRFRRCHPRRAIGLPSRRAPGAARERLRARLRMGEAPRGLVARNLSLPHCSPIAAGEPWRAQPCEILSSVDRLE
jgi:hypothetical protein